jgi:hypothetical protein
VELLARPAAQQTNAENSHPPRRVYVPNGITHDEALGWLDLQFLLAQQEQVGVLVNFRDHIAVDSHGAWAQGQGAERLLEFRLWTRRARVKRTPQASFAKRTGARRPNRSMCREGRI